MQVCRKLRCFAVRFISATAVLLLLIVAANAYTIVMRGGRRLEIPAGFVVTQSTLTYEVAPGIQVTLEIAAIDISATEKANAESPGSLLRRVGVNAQAMELNQQSGAAKLTARKPLTITNRELQASARRRLDSELAYDVRRKELGLPSAAEARRQASLQSESIQRDLDEKRNAEQQAETYWRTQAETLRTELAAVDAELRYIRARLDETSFGNSQTWASSAYTVSGTLPILQSGNFGHSINRESGRFHPNVYLATGGSQISAGVGFGGGGTRGQVFLNPQTFRHPSPGFGPSLGGVGIGPRTALGLPVVVSAPFVNALDYSYERGALITRFNELAGARAGLNARWRQLEEAARRAGAPPGWLRP